MSFDIISSTKNITDKYIRYLNTTFDIDDPIYHDLLEKRMKEVGTFAKGPYLDVVNSFESGEAVNDLIAKGELNKDFERVDSVYNKVLYKHQESAIRKIREGKNIVVSTGTGSGKTESFIIPIINSLMEEKEQKGKLEPGVRALLIYPMNALANDQISRLRDLLKDYKDITFGSYTGQTEQTERKALIKYRSLNKNTDPLENEIISREKMKDQPPHLLITNYSMLEYLMLRPKDSVFFQGDFSHEWRFIVLDEAHTYSGSTGIEVSMLLRRLKAIVNAPDIRFILTSATLGGENSNDEVATFAERLCDAPFCADNVIRASRIELQPSSADLIKLTAEDYRKLNEFIDSGYSEEKTLSLVKGYLKIDIDVSDYYEYLYDALLMDQTYWKVKNLLDTPQTVDYVCEEMSWNKTQVSDFVNVASHAIKNRKKLFDSRYHMFLRATEGVFVTLGNHKDLSLTRQTVKHIDENTVYKYFEAVTCNQCHAMYLIGERDKDPCSGLSTLKQKSNAGGTNYKEAYLVGDITDDFDEDSAPEDGSPDQVVKFLLCPHCGYIKQSNQVSKSKCKHSEDEYVLLTHVKSSSGGRVTRCLKCRGVNNHGIIRSFFAGQEASTSVIGTALFEEIPEAEIEITECAADESGFESDDSGFEYSESKKLTKKAKQYIAFSDNRQAAAYFATYFGRTYQEILFSRLINESIKNVDKNGKPMNLFVDDISSDFRDGKVSSTDLYIKDIDYRKEAWKAVIKELIDSYSRTSLIGLGLLKLGFVDSVNIMKNGKFNLSKEEVADICMVLLRSLLQDNAILYPVKMTDADIDFFSNNGSQTAYELVSNDSRTVSFIPKKDNATNKRTEYLERVFNAKGEQVTRNDLNNLIRGIWERILIGSGILCAAKDYNGYRVDITKFKVVNTNDWYKCNKCQRVTSYNVCGVCPTFKCSGKLNEVNIETLEEDNHYYRLYNDLDIRPLRIVEHTAQLKSEKAYKLQEMFKNQEIDVLSCSTTFEMGVDIGDLETVFMRNMPPTPANYVQRAGRAGRSSKAAALALTFCNKSNHDFSFFNNPLSMIDGEIKPPLFKVENEKIGIRHLYSAALAFFWKEYPDYFGLVKSFFGSEDSGSGYSDLKTYIDGHPQELREYLLNALPRELVERFEIESWGWTGWLFDSPNPSYPNLKNVYEEYRSEVDSLYEEKERIHSEGTNNTSILYRISTYINEDIISFLSRNNILPKYGFPVDTVELRISAKNKDESIPVDLSRDLSMAISEYAPGCEVVADGHLITSKYIRKMPQKEWRCYDYDFCDSCRSLSISVHLDSKASSKTRICSCCGVPIEGMRKTFIIPEFGFIAENSIKKPTLIKPERTYRTEASIVAEGDAVVNATYTIGTMPVDVYATESGEIAVLNSSDFYVCKKCGFSENQKKIDQYTPFTTLEHKNSAGFTCKNEILNRYSLGYRFKTDSLRISVHDDYDYEEAYSILQATVISACNVLNLDNNEIAGCLKYRSGNMGYSYDFILYDTTPGGAGHVKRIAEENNLLKVFEFAYDKANQCDCGGEDCDTSCYKCLRTYQNQHYHDIIKRKYVIDKLGKMMAE